MPDVASRAFLAAVVEASKGWGAAGAGAAAAVGSSASLSSQWQQQQQPLPVLGLVDWNPGGVGILLAYKYGCAAMGLESARWEARTGKGTKPKLDLGPASQISALTEPQFSFKTGFVGFCCCCFCL